MAGSLRRLLFLCAGVVVGLAFPAVGSACPFCSMQGQTLTGEVNQATMVLYGTLTNARLGGGDGLGDGSTDLQIEAIVKKHDILGDRKVITLPRYVPTDDKNTRFLIFCDVFKGKVDPYRGVPVKPGSDIVKYLQGATAVADKSVTDRLKFFFNYLDNDDIEIANDAYKEFGNADYPDFRKMAGDLPSAKVASWLRDPKTPAFRYGLYASMLGHCGKESDATVLREMLDDPEKQTSSGIDGVLAGYTMLKPKEGWDHILGLLKDERKEFLLRYAALRSVRFLHDYRQDLIDPKELVAGVSHLLDDKNMADLAIEDLRKWKRWELAGRVIGLHEKPSHDVPIVKRAVLRYALSCPDPLAVAFVAEQRKADPDRVADIEELLKLENLAPAPTTAQPSR